MANSVYPFITAGVSTDTGEYQRLYNISINQSAFNSTATSDASGGVTPASYRDYATLPSSTNNSKRLARGGLRYKRMLELLGTYSNFTVHKLQLDSSADQDTQQTSLQFNIGFQNDSAIPSTITSIDGSTSVTTVEGVLKELVAQALNSSYTERLTVYNTTAARGQENVEITASAVNSAGEILEAITVTRIGEFDQQGDAETVTDNN